MSQIKWRNLGSLQIGVIFVCSAKSTYSLFLIRLIDHEYIRIQSHPHANSNNIGPIKTLYLISWKLFHIFNFCSVFLADSDSSSIAPTVVGLHRNYAPVYFNVNICTSLLKFNTKSTTIDIQSNLLTPK